MPQKARQINRTPLQEMELLQNSWSIVNEPDGPRVMATMTVLAPDYAAEINLQPLVGINGANVFSIFERGRGLAYRHDHYRGQLGFLGMRSMIHTSREVYQGRVTESTTVLSASKGIGMPTEPGQVLKVVPIDTVSVIPSGETELLVNNALQYPERYKDAFMIQIVCHAIEEHLRGETYTGDSIQEWQTRSLQDRLAS